MSLTVSQGISSLHMSAIVRMTPKSSLQHVVEERDMRRRHNDASRYLYHQVFGIPHDAQNSEHTSGKRTRAEIQISHQEGTELTYFACAGMKLRILRCEEALRRRAMERHSRSSRKRPKPFCEKETQGSANTCEEATGQHANSTFLSYRRPVTMRRA